MKRLTFFALALALALASPAQDTVRWSAHIGGTALFRDAEYFMPFTKGYTISGFRVAPTLQYHVGDLHFEGGALLTAVAGTEGLYRAEPVLTVSYRPLDWLTLNMGTLKGGNLLGDAQHNVGEPMLDPERWYLSPKEDGVQILTGCSSKNCLFNWRSDTWVNWERFFLPAQADQERFTLGSAHRLSLRSLRLDAAFMGCHRGGQFSALDTCIETLFNERLGLGYTFSFGSRNSLTLSADAYFFQNASPERHRHTAYTSGYGLHPHATLAMPFGKRSDDRLELGLGYWYGHQYLSARGSWLYQSASWCDPAYLQPQRHMLTAGLSFTHNRLNLNAQLYHDLSLHRTDFALSLILHFQATHPLL